MFLDTLPLILVHSCTLLCLTCYLEMMNMSRFEKVSSPVCRVATYVSSIEVDGEDARDQVPGGLDALQARTIHRPHETPPLHSSPTDKCRVSPSGAERLNLTCFVARS